MTNVIVSDCCIFQCLWKADMLFFAFAENYDITQVKVGAAFTSLMSGSFKTKEFRI